MDGFTKVEGIILKSFDYKERQRILRVFTQNGMDSFVAYLSKNQHSTGACQPLCLCEFYYKNTPSELKQTREIYLLEPHLKIREDFDKIEAAGAIIRSLLQTQLPEKPSKTLYHLTKVYLSHLQITKKPKELKVSFLLKLMRYEGLFESCQMSFDQEEQILVNALCYTKDFSLIEEIELDTSLTKKIEAFFEERVCV